MSFMARILTPELTPIAGVVLVFFGAVIGYMMGRDDRKGRNARNSDN